MSEPRIVSTGTASDISLIDIMEYSEVGVGNHSQNMTCIKAGDIEINGNVVVDPGFRIPASPFVLELTNGDESEFIIIQS